MEVPGLGTLTKQKGTGWYVSEPIAIPMLGGRQCRIALDGYQDDPRPEDFHVAIANFLAGTPDVLRAADDALFAYYKDMEEYWLEDGEEPIESADELWQLVELGDEPLVQRRDGGDEGIYISLDGNCEWEPEHGLQIVLKNGLQVNKLGEYDSHLTNSDAYDDPEYENVIYPPRG